MDKFKWKNFYGTTIKVNPSEPTKPILYLCIEETIKLFESIGKYPPINLVKYKLQYDREHKTKLNPARLPK